MLLSHWSSVSESEEAVSYHGQNDPSEEAVSYHGQNDPSEKAGSSVISWSDQNRPIGVQQRITPSEVDSGLQ